MRNCNNHYKRQEIRLIQRILTTSTISFPLSEGGRGEVTSRVKGGIRSVKRKVTSRTKGEVTRVIGGRLPKGLRKSSLVKNFSFLYTNHN